MEESAIINEKNPSSNPCWGERFVIPISLVLGGEDKGLIACKTERHSKDRLTEGERRKGKRRDKERKMERFGWLGLRDDREPGALLQEKVKHFHKSVLEEFTCSGGRLKSCHTWLVEREKPIPNAGGHLHRRKKKKKNCASSLHFPHRAICRTTIPRADAGRMSSFPLHSQAECTKIQRREKHNKFRLQVRVPAGNKMEDEQWRLDGRRVCSNGGLHLKKERNAALDCTISSLKFTTPRKSIYSTIFHRDAMTDNSYI